MCSTRFSVGTTPHADDISPTGVDASFYIHNGTINRRSCCSSKCGKQFRRRTCSSLMHSVNSYSAALTPVSVACSITKPFWGGEGFTGGRVTAKPQHCDTKHLNASQSPASSSSSSAAQRSSFFVWVILRVLLAFIGNDIWMFQSDTCDAAETDADSFTPSSPSPASLPVLIVTLFRLLPRRVVSHFLRLPTVSQSLLLPAGLTGVVLATHGQLMALL